MKIGVLTYHNTNNFGAALQCYALQKKINDYGHSCEIIDYRNSLVSSDNRNKESLIKKMVRMPLLKYKKSKFNKFTKKFINISRITFNDNNISNDLYDLFVIGSDQVWNYKINGGDTTYMMDFVSNPQKIRTYACSIGNIDIPEEILLNYKKYLSRIDNILVREESTKNFVKKLTNKNAIIVPDPVFLLSKDEWDKLSNKSTKKGEYVISYFVGKSSSKVVNNIYEHISNGTKLLKIAGGLSISDLKNKNIKVDFGISPIDFVNYIKNSKFVITDSFHATAFCLLFNKPFVVFLANDYAKDSRIISLLKKYKMESHIYSNSLKDIDKMTTIYNNDENTIRLNMEANENLQKYTLKENK